MDVPFWTLSFSLFTCSISLPDRKQKVHNCSETEYVGHIFPHMTFAQFCTLQPNPILCHRLFLFLSVSFNTHSLLLGFSGVIFLGHLSTLSLYSTFLLFCSVIPPPLFSTLLLNVFSYVF